MTQIIIADDHPIVRSGVKQVLKNHFGLSTQIYEAENGSQIIDHCKQYNIDILVMDLNMPNTDPQRVVQTSLALRPEIKIIILSMNQETIFGPLYFKSGIKAFVPKELGEGELLNAIKVVMQGKVYFRQEMKDFYDKSKNPNYPYDVLSQKELGILCQLIKGDPIAQIAKTMNLGITTVSTHKANIFEKLQVSNLLQLKELTDLYPLSS